MLLGSVKGREGMHDKVVEERIMIDWISVRGTSGEDVKLIQLARDAVVWWALEPRKMREISSVDEWFWAYEECFCPECVVKWDLNGCWYTSV
jgi:hypothetical protein